jgi:GNAT superfamily N-acetyltransferase
MLLAELFQRLPEDYGTLPHANIPSFDPRYSKVVGKFDGYDIWGSRELVGFDTFGIIDMGTVLAVCRIGATGSNNIYPLYEVWTHPNHRGQGLATILMLFIIRKLGIKLLLGADEIVSDDSRNMIWKGLVSKKYKMYRPDGTLVDMDDAKRILFTTGKTDDAVILAETKLNFELFSDTKIDSRSTWYFVRGMNQDLD